MNSESVLEVDVTEAGKMSKYLRHFDKNLFVMTIELDPSSSKTAGLV